MKWSSEQRFGRDVLTTFRRMTQDPWVMSACGLSLAAVIGIHWLPEAVPWQRWVWLLPALVPPAIMAARASSTSDGERRFWTWAVVAQGAWLVALVLRALVPSSHPADVESSGSDLVLWGPDFFLSLHFLAWIVAAEQRPDHRRSAANRRLDLLWTQPAALLFVLGLLIYFLGVAHWHRHSVPELHFQSFLVFFTLGLLIAGRFLVFAVETVSRQWRRQFGLLAAAHGMVLLGDLIHVRSHGLYGLWIVPATWFSCCLLIAATRIKGLRLLGSRVGSRPAGVTLDLSAAHRSTTLIWALTLPFLHVLLHHAGVLPAAGRDLRQAVVLWALVLLGGYALLQRYRVELETVDEWRRRQAMAEELRSSEQDLRILVERNRGRRELEASERRFATAFQLSPEAMLITTVDEGRVIDANESFCSLFSVEAESVVGSLTSDLGFWPNPRRRREILDEVVARGTLRDLTWAWRPKDAESMLLNASFELIQAGQDVVVLSILHDITPSGPDLLEEMDLLSPVSVAVMALDPSETVVFWNGAAESIFGWSAEEAEGQTASELGLTALVRGQRSSGRALTRVRATGREGVPLRLSYRSAPLDSGGSLFFAAVSHGGSRLAARRSGR